MYCRTQRILEVVDMHVHLNYITHLAHFIKGDHDHLTIADGGADTCVLGSGWRMHKVYKHCVANLYGFNSAYTKKKGLPIGTVEAVIYGVDSKRKMFPFIAHIHEAILNVTSQTTLLLEAKVHYKGHIADLVH